MTESTLTIADLVGDPTLGTHVVAGADGLDRAVLWAHSCEMPDPARWLGPSELLMTIGRCVPAGSEAQRAFVAALDDAGLAGMTVGDHDIAPRYTKAMIAEAEARSFPILATDVYTPFAAIGRSVAAANANAQTVEVLLLSRLYQLAARQDLASRRSGSGLRDLFGTEVTVVDDATGCVVVGRGALRGAGGRASPLRTHRPTRMVIAEGAPLDAFSLVHLAQVLAVDANAILQDAERRMRRGAAVVEALLAGDAAAAARTLEAAWGGGDGGYAVVALRSADVARDRLALALADLPVASGTARGTVACVVPARALEGMRSLAGELGVAAGASEPFDALGETGAAASEAWAALAAGEETGAAWHVHDGAGVSLLARSRGEARSLVRRVLGPLAGDDARASGLRDTVFAFLDHDLKWQATADALGIHRQTLVYRMRTAGELTGRDVRTTRDVAELWLAREAWRRLATA